MRSISTDYSQNPKGVGGGGVAIPTVSLDFTQIFTDAQTLVYGKAPTERTDTMDSSAKEKGAGKKWRGSPFPPISPF